MKTFDSDPVYACTLAPSDKCPCTWPCSQRHPCTQSIVIHASKYEYNHVYGCVDGGVHEHYILQTEIMTSKVDLYIFSLVSLSFTTKRPQINFQQNLKHYALHNVQQHPQILCTILYIFINLTLIFRFFF